MSAKLLKSSAVGVLVALAEVRQHPRVDNGEVFVVERCDVVKR